MVSQEYSSKACSKLTLLVSSFFTSARLRFFLGSVHGLRFTTNGVLKGVVNFRFWTPCNNPLGVCRKCLLSWLEDLPSLKGAFNLDEVLERCWSAVSVEVDTTKIKCLLYNFTILKNLCL